MATNTAIQSHQEWLGFVQPVGLVVSIPALEQAQAFINRNFIPSHKRLLEALQKDPNKDPIPEIHGMFSRFAETALGWDPAYVYGAEGSPPVPDDLRTVLPEYNDTIRPEYGLKNSEGEWVLLVQALAHGTRFDNPAAEANYGWQASPQARHERLLRETGIPIGLLVNGGQIRLTYAPAGEASGYITFNLSEMIQIAGRPIWAAAEMLLGQERLLLGPKETRLPAILANSRKFQSTVSTELAEQVLEALYELLRGFQAANDQTNGTLLGNILKSDPRQVYTGMVIVLLRMIFLLYAEDNGLLSNDPAFQNHYSLPALYARLRDDAGHHPDTMDQRFGAWAHLLALFRLIHSGGRHGQFGLPAREGYLFDPDRYPFLEGFVENGKHRIPNVPDGVVYRILEKLLILNGERLSYRTLAVEQIGSVYEAIMGFDLEIATGPSVAIKPVKRAGAPVTIDLDALLATAATDRAKWFTEKTGQKLTAAALENLKTAPSLEALQAALESKIAKGITPGPAPKGAMVFQPSEERRRSGSHYTPRLLTEPIVRETLAPVLQQLGENPTPTQILSLKICDPAMGSGAFLVEACRQLGDALVAAWRRHEQMPLIPLDEDERLHARRIVAQRCLYGVDKNPLAADLAKLSLWLATLAKDHPFTFLDHCLRCGDSLAGLSPRQIASFNWEPGQQHEILGETIHKTIVRVSEERSRILDARDDIPYGNLIARLDKADEALYWPRLAGDTIVAAFFSKPKSKDREQARATAATEFLIAIGHPGKLELANPFETLTRIQLRAEQGITPFHWAMEFPEVFSVDKKGEISGGFDAIIGNPPFAGKNTLKQGNAASYPDWLKTIHEESHGNADLAAHFFRRAFSLLRPDGCMGLIATNTISQGDTRSTGLRWICTHGGTIYRATKRYQWPGEAAVVVSVVHIRKGAAAGPFSLDGRETPIITAFLFHGGGHDDPARLKANADKSFQGCIVLGMGFTFDDTDRSGTASPISEMHRLIEKDPRNAERIFPYIGGEEVNTHPTQAHHRFVIDFADYPLRRDSTGNSWANADDSTRKHWLQEGIVPLDYPGPVAADWPDLLKIVEEKVRPQRLLLSGNTTAMHRNKLWWRFGALASS